MYMKKLKHCCFWIRANIWVVGRPVELGLDVELSVRFSYTQSKDNLAALTAVNLEADALCHSALVL